MKTSKKALIGILIYLLMILVVLSACGEKDITVSFDSDGGSSVESITLKANTPISLPEAPTKEGYSFVGWVMADDDQTAVEDGYQFPSDTTAVTLRAVWEEEKTEDADVEQTDESSDTEKTDENNDAQKDEEAVYTVTFDSRGGTSVKKQVISVDKPIHLGQNPTREGYRFVTWEDKWGMPIGHGQEDTDVTLDVKAGDTIELYAVWEEAEAGS